MWDQPKLYGFGADAALAAALAAAAASAAAVAAASAAGAAGAAAGGGVAAAGAGASVLLPQALSTSAATKALRAILVFIYRYPRNLRIKKRRPSVLFLGLYPKVQPDFRGFHPNFISLSPLINAFNVKDRHRGLKIYSSYVFWRILWAAHDGGHVNDSSLDQLYVSHLAALMRRTDRSLAASGFDALVIHSGRPPLQFLDDQDYPFKVNPQFKAWVPVVDNPRCILVYRPSDRPTLLFHRPNDFWHKPAKLPSAPWTAAVNLIAIDDDAKAAPHWANLGRAAFIGPESAMAGVDPANFNPPNLLALLDFDRAVKTPYELECIRRASELGARGHAAALAAFQRGGSEYDVHMSYLEACEQREEEMPYNNIVAYNENAAVLHYQHLERAAPPKMRSFLIDAGAQYRGYAADITRTYARDSGRFAELVEATDGAQRALCDEIVAGRDYREVHLSAHRILGDVMHRVGLTKLPGQAALESGVSSVFFPHGIGHLLGLQVHDVGGVMGDASGRERERPQGHPYLRLTRMLEPGVVVTVEPGIYLIDSLLTAAHADSRRPHIDWNVVEELKPYGGVRIEDNVATTTAKPENLTRDAFARVAA
jgi:Xaa-Pro dipeptidase